MNNSILIVDMPQGSRTNIERAAGQSGYSTEFCSISELEERPEFFSPDILIYAARSKSEEKDIKMIRDYSASLRIPLFAVIAAEDKNLYVRLLQSGIYGIITSPVMKTDFLNTISHAAELPECSSGNSLGLNVKCRNSEKEEIKTIEISKGNLDSLFDSLMTNLINQSKIAKVNLKRALRHEKKHRERLERNRGLREHEKKLWDYHEQNRFRLFYQPVVSFSSGRLSGFEALIRIDDPEEGIITPDKFISVAENSALIFPLGLWIIEEACSQIREWKEKIGNSYPVRINVNLSPRQFLHPGLTENIFEITERYRIEPEDLGFELTESSFMEDMEAANMALLELRARKFPVYMDDFGTGYSSLSYLMHFPVNIIKIDQSFVKWMHIDESSETIVKSIITLSHSLGLKVVAEGIDDECHIQMLRDLDCDYGQGYFIAKPLSAHDAEEFIRKGYQLSTNYQC